MVEHNPLEELKTQLGLLQDIIRHTDVNDPKMEPLCEMLSMMYQKLIELDPPKDKLDKPLLSDDSL